MVVIFCRYFLILIQAKNKGIFILMCFNLIFVMLEYVTQVWRENQDRSFAAHFHRDRRLDLLLGDRLQ